MRFDNNNNYWSVVWCWWMIIAIIIVVTTTTDTIVLVSCVDVIEQDSYISSDGTVTIPQQQKQKHNLIIDSVNNNNSGIIYYDNYNQYNYSKDPNLHRMPNYDFDAYVRPDILSYYRHNNDRNFVSNNVNEQIPHFNGLAGKFINISPDRVSLYWIGDIHHTYEPSVIDYEIKPWGAGGTASYPTHRFTMTKYNSPKDIICTITVQIKISVYYCNPYELSDNNNNTTIIKEYEYSRRGIVTNGYERQYNTLTNDQKLNYYNAHILNLQFGDEYQNFTNGSPWLAMYPPNPLLHPIIATDYFGQIHTVTTTESHFHTIPPIPKSTFTNRNTTLSTEQMKNPNEYINMNQYRYNESLTLQLKVISCLPKVLSIDTFLSDVEVEHMLQIVNSKTLIRSETSNGQISSTRTSRTAWIMRNHDYIINSIYRRVANIVNISEALIRPHTSDEVNPNNPKIKKSTSSTLSTLSNTTLPYIETLNTISEDIQIVHYDPKQEYSSHHDFEYAIGINKDDKKSRTLNLAMYLKDVEEGGETSFPRYRNINTGEVLKIKPRKGNAILFYMVNPDGNLEDMSQHAGMPVIKGEKYFANLWLHTYH